MQDYVTACKLMSYVTACKLMDLYAILEHSGTFWNILHAFWNILHAGFNFMSSHQESNYHMLVI